MHLDIHWKVFSERYPGAGLPHLGGQLAEDLQGALQRRDYQEGPHLGGRLCLLAEHDALRGAFSRVQGRVDRATGGAAVLLQDGALLRGGLRHV